MYLRNWNLNWIKIQNAYIAVIICILSNIQISNNIIYFNSHAIVGYTNIYYFMKIRMYDTIYY